MRTTRFPARRWIAGGVLTAAALTAWSLWPSPPATLDAAPVDSPIAIEAAGRAEDIALFERRATEDPYGGSDLARVATLYLQRARETGNVEDYRRAEQSARTSLERRAEHNGGARLALASSLLAQHRFPEARTAAEGLVANDPDKPAARALLGELQVEMGDYEAARVTFDSLWRHRGNLAVAPRLARWKELSGELPQARQILLGAREQAAARTDLPREQVAWFHLRLLDHDLRTGRLDRADASLREGLAVDPADPRLLSAAARLAALRGEWREVLALGDRIGDRMDLATLALTGDAHLALGDSAKATARFDAVEAQAAANPEPFNRQWTAFRLEHGRALPATLALLRDEIGIRRDVYGYDQLAWALHLSGDHAAARTAMQQAMRLGTPDAVLHYHAGMIARALGDTRGARDQLGQALARNAHFHPTQAAEARSTLQAMIAETRIAGRGASQ